MLFLINISLIQHLLENLFTALCILIGIADRIITGRILRDRSNDRAFRQIQFGYVFIKIPRGCRLNTERILTQVDRI